MVVDSELLQRISYKEAISRLIANVEAEIDLSSRELAILSWIGLFLIYALCNSTIRQSVRDIVISAGKVVSQPVFQIFVAYQLLLIVGFEKYHLPGLTFASIKDYLILFIFTITPFLIKARMDTFWKAFIQSFGFGAIGQFFISTYTFSYWIEMILMPTIVFVSVVGVTISISDSRVKNVVNGLLSIVGWILIIHSIISVLNTGFKQMLSWSYLEGIAIEPITWIINLPLVILAIPMIQYDVIDNFRAPKKNALRVLLHSIIFLIGWMSLICFTGLRLRRAVRDVHSGGLLGRRMQIFINSNVGLWKVKMIQYLYRYMLMPRHDYHHGNRSIPIRVECRHADSLELLIPPYEVSGLMDDYKLS